MKSVTRRTAIAGLTGIGFSSLVSCPHQARADDKQPTEKREHIVLGPFKLGEWFDSSKKEIDGLFNQGAPKREDIINSFNECLAYIIDERVWKDEKKIEFTSGKYHKPELVITGKFVHSWESSNKKKTFVIQIVELTATLNTTNYVNNPATRTVIVNIGIETAGGSLLTNTSSKINFYPSNQIKYDINGKLIS